MAAYGLYSHIESNKRRSILLLAGLFVLVYLMVYAGALVGEAMSYQASLPYLLRKAWTDLLAAAPLATLGTAVWIAIAYYFHQSMIDALTGGREVTRAEAPRLYNLLENLCISRGIAMPKLKVMESDALNAFSTGMNEKQYAITVTTALLARLDDAELEAVLGHELTHIRNGDVRMLVVAVIIAGAISFFAEMFFRLWFNWGGWGGGFGRRRSGGGDGGRGDGGRGKGGNVIAIVIAIALVAVAWLLSGVIRFALSRTREFLADAGAVELTKNPDAMISALRKIEGRGELIGATSAVMEMCVDNPREEFTDLFSTHPPIEARIKALVDVMGGHDPGPLALPGPGEEEQGAQEQAGTQAQSQKLPGGAPGPWGNAQGVVPRDGATQGGGAGQAPQPAGPWGEPAAADAPAPEGPGGPAARPFLPDRPPIDLGNAPPPDGGPAEPWGKPGGRT
jgi:heat shock protein HtpX